MADFSMKTDSSGVATLTWNAVGRSMNVLTQPAYETFAMLIDRALADESVRGLVITSGKPDFSGGIDLNALAQLVEQEKEAPARGVFDFVMKGHHILRRLERAGMDAQNSGGKPIACAITGTCAGIGTEIALACHHRVMADTPLARVGLPEIRVGLFPGGGGTTRLTHMLGIAAAAPILLEGKMVDPHTAKAAGLIDALAEDPLESARHWVLQASQEDIVKPWDRKGYKMPGGTPYQASGFMTCMGASAMVHGKTWGAAPAVKALLSAIYEGALVPFDTALRIEARWFTHLLLQPSPRAMIRSLFVNRRALQKGAARPAQVARQQVKKLGVLGAGMMGSGIAFVSARAGMEVVLLDQTQQTAERGKAFCATTIDKAIARGRAEADHKAALLSRIHATAEFHALRGCDLVIEAVFEDPQVKTDTLARAQGAVPPETILASNTSTLPIQDLAAGLKRPDQFVGIHFFSPVDRMQLVEIIKAPQTGPRAVAQAFDYVRKIGKTAILVNDARFFYANRCILPYLNEGIRMVGEGVAPALIDHAARLLGFPVGPLRLVDETSLDLGARIARANRAQMGVAYGNEDADRVVQHLIDQGRLGRKAKAGFHDYDARGRRLGYWPGLARRYPPQALQPDLVHVQHRLLFVQVIEAVSALEQRVLSDLREGDVGAVLGWGFMPWSGGPFSWLDIVGAQWAVERCDLLAKRYGARFECPPLLRGMAERGERFYNAHSIAAEAV